MLRLALFEIQQRKKKRKFSNYLNIFDVIVLFD